MRGSALGFMRKATIGWGEGFERGLRGVQFVAARLIWSDSGGGQDLARASRLALPRHS